MGHIPAIDLFAGAGGLGLGAAAAGAEVRLSVDFDGASCETLRANPAFVEGAVLQADVSALSGHDLRVVAGVSPSDPLLIIGGAPCQAFSKAAYWLEDGDEARYRRARATGNAAPKPTQGPRAPDLRRDLVWQFWRLVKESRAQAFLFENVPSILHPRNRKYIDGLIRHAEEAGFHCRIVRANAVEYGVPQRRHRVFVVASRAGVPEVPVRTHGDRRGAAGLMTAVTAGEALRTISSATSTEPEELVTGRWAEHLAAVPPGWNYKFHTAWGGHLEPTFVAETRFWNFLLKLSPDLPSWTISANPGPWVGPFHWDSRRLRTAELAALQSFPPDYRFEGGRRDRVRQIGNAVPPRMAEAVVRTVLAAMTGQTRRAA